MSDVLGSKIREASKTAAVDDVPTLRAALRECELFLRVLGLESEPAAKVAENARDALLAQPEAAGALAVEGCITDEVDDPNGQCPTCFQYLRTDATAGGRGMVSLVNYLGDDKIRFQVVHQSIDGDVTLRKDGTTRFTMATEHANLTPDDLLTGKPRRYGLLLWVDAAEFDSWRNLPDTKPGSAA